MTVGDNNQFATMRLSHLELYVQNMEKMERFYTQSLGFAVTDRGQGETAMVFLSHSPDEHHQIVLNPHPSPRPVASPVDHISFRVASISALRRFHASLQSNPDIGVQCVSHGTTWSIYFRDPENNRFEIFTDTPWHVNQPCKFTVDLEQPDEALMRFTKAKIEHLPGFTTAEEWQAAHKKTLNRA